MTVTISEKASINNIDHSKEHKNSYVLPTAFQPFKNTRMWLASSANKKPICPSSGKSEGWNKPENWGTYDDVKHFIAEHPDHIPAIVISKESALVGIDLDHVIDTQGNVAPWAQEILNQLPEAYIEKGSSGHGFHLFMLGTKPGNKIYKNFENEQKLEVYGVPDISPKPLRLTGLQCNQCEQLKDLSAAIAEIYKEYWPENITKEKESASYKKSPPLSDDEVIKILKGANNAQKFNKLFLEGTLSEYKSDPSSAEQALCNMLAFYTQDFEQLDRLIRSSQLFKEAKKIRISKNKPENKWEDREDYRVNTINKALNNLTTTWQPKQINQKDGYARINESIENYSEVPDTAFPLHALPLSLKEAVEEVSRINKVDPSLAALPGIGLIALQIGKKALIQEKPGLTHHASIFLCGVAESGERKSSTFERMTEGLKEAMAQAENQYRADSAKIKAYNEVITEKIKEAKKALAKLEDVESKEAEDLVTKIGELTLTARLDVAEPQNYFDDITPQRIFQKLHVHKGAFGIISSEGRGILHRIMGKGSQDGSTQENIFLSGMWGDDISRSRVGSNKGEIGGEDIIIRKPALTTVCLVQPDVWKEVCKDLRLRASGFISRVQVVNIPSTIGNRIEEKGEAKCDSSKLEKYNHALISLWKWKREQPLMVYLDEHAQERRREFHNMIEQELKIGSSLEDVRDIASKAVSLTCRIALNFTLIKIADQNPNALNSLQEVFITENDWINAQELQEYFLAQAITSQRENSKTGKTHILVRAIRWIKKYHADGTSFDARDLGKALGGGMLSQESNELCNELVKQEVIRIVPPNTVIGSKKRTKTYVVEAGYLSCNT